LHTTFSSDVQNNHLIPLLTDPQNQMILAAAGVLLLQPKLGPELM
jgi:hypothetical protein